MSDLDEVGVAGGALWEGFFDVLHEGVEAGRRQQLHTPEDHAHGGQKRREEHSERKGEHSLVGEMKGLLMAEL